MIARISGNIWKLVADTEAFKAALPDNRTINGNGAGGKIWVETGETMKSLFLVMYRNENFEVKIFEPNCTKYGLTPEMCNGIVARAQAASQAK